MPLQAYDLRIELTKGEINTVADALSRPHLDIRDACYTQIDMPSKQQSKIRDEQLKCLNFTKNVKL